MYTCTYTDKEKKLAGEELTLYCKKNMVSFLLSTLDF